MYNMGSEIWFYIYLNLIKIQKNYKIMTNVSLKKEIYD